MNALVALRKVITANRDPENVAEIRSYIEDHVVELAPDLGVSTDTITKTLATLHDEALATSMLKLVREAQARQRDLKTDGRAKSAQSAADALGSRAAWDGERVQLDVPTLLSSALTKRTDMVVFTTSEFAVGVYQAPLFDLARLKLRDLTGFVDAEGLHVRWKTGGLNLRSRIDPHADRVTLSLSPKTAAVAA